MDSRNRFLWKVRLSALVIATSASSISPTYLMAQTDSRGTTVLGRERPELNPAGLRISGFILSPSIGVGTTFNDNIFSTQSGKKSDVVTTVSPELLFASDWNQHSLRFSGEGIVSRYANNDIEDHETFDLKADGRLDVYRDMSVTGALGYQLGSEERGSVDEAGGLTPTEFTIGTFAGDIFTIGTVCLQGRVGDTKQTILMMSRLTLDQSTTMIETEMSMFSTRVSVMKSNLSTKLSFS